MGIPLHPLSLTFSVLLVAPKRLPLLPFVSNELCIGAANYFSLLQYFPCPNLTYQKCHWVPCQGHEKTVMDLPELCVFLTLMSEDVAWNI